MLDLPAGKLRQTLADRGWKITFNEQKVIFWVYVNLTVGHPENDDSPWFSLEKNAGKTPTKWRCLRKHHQQATYQTYTMGRVFTSYVQLLEAKT